MLILPQVTIDIRTCSSVAGRVLRDRRKKLVNAKILKDQACNLFFFSPNFQDVMDVSSRILEEKLFTQNSGKSIKSHISRMFVAITCVCIVASRLNDRVCLKLASL